MGENIRGKALSGIAWGMMEKLSLQIFGFVQGVILARLLSPSDYGLIAMVGIFVLLSYTFVDAGFGTALIQKHDRTEKDYSTVFVLNLSISFIISLILFFCAPIIADFYGEKLLIKIVRVYSLLIFLSSLIAIQDVRLSIYLEFKKKSIINIVTTVVSGLFAILMAFMGYGVWSLLIPQFVMLITKCSFYWHFQHWIPKFYFSKQSCKELFGFGSKILASSILATFFENIYSLVIGKVFSAKALGFYSRADGYANLPVKTITGVIDSVTYPVLSKYQDDDKLLISAFGRMLRIAAYIIFPIMIGIGVLAKPLIIVLVTEKWLPCVVYLQLLCLARMWWHVHVLNLNILKAKGYSDLFFRLEIIKKILIIVLLIATVPFGIMAMCIGSIVSAFISMCINSYYTGKLFQFGIMKQMKEMLPSILYSLVMGAIMYISILFLPSMWLKLSVGILVGIISYILMSVATKSQDFNYLLALVHDKNGR